MGPNLLERFERSCCQANPSGQLTMGATMPGDDAAKVDHGALGGCQRAIRVSHSLSTSDWKRLGLAPMKRHAIAPPCQLNGSSQGLYMRYVRTKHQSVVSLEDVKQFALQSRVGRRWRKQIVSAAHENRHHNDEQER